MPAGEKRDRVSFYRPVSKDDGYGNSVSGFSDWPDFTYAAMVIPKLGGETVLAGRLSGRGLENITVPSTTETRSVTTDWKAKNERSGIEYNIRDIIDPDGKRRSLEMLCEKGVAV